jgi:NAD(P)-dependent dehydrogenase (short-subunit alcohol dehydrogenase family)
VDARALRVVETRDIARAPVNISDYRGWCRWADDGIAIGTAAGRGAGEDAARHRGVERKGSSVILTGSMVSIKGFAPCSVYNASKAAVRSFARTWIVDLKGRDISVNVLSPGHTDTPGLSHFCDG